MGEDDPDPRRSFSQLELTPEERAVLLQCRRKSLIRGMVAGSGVCMLLFWLKAQGRIPSVVNQFPGFFYTMAFFGPFSAGFGSYQKICYRKIMSLENSTLRKAVEEYEKAFQKKSARRQRVPEGDYDPKRLKHPPESPAPPLPKRPTEDTSSASPPSLNTKLDEGPSINIRTYSRDKSMLETKEHEVEQPSAFSGVEGSAPVDFSKTPQDTPTKKGRTFDEIREENREENRLRNSQQQRYPTSQQSGSKTGDERKRRNKYGDVVEP